MIDEDVGKLTKLSKRNTPQANSVEKMMSGTDGEILTLDEVAAYLRNEYEITWTFLDAVVELLSEALAAKNTAAKSLLITGTLLR
jgi:hypothetical protein